MINVIGLGYIGLPTSLILASSGQKVIGTDVNSRLVETLNNGQLTFEEKGITNLFQEAVAKGIEFSTSYQQTDQYIITVPTPYDKNSKKIDASYVVKAVEKVLECCLENTIIVIESTVSPGTIDKEIRPLIDDSKWELNKNIFLVHAPERILPGNMVAELRNNSRTIGADLPEVAEKVQKVYASFCMGEITCTDIRTAEMSKVVENTYRAVNIAFANELLVLAEHAGLDIYEIIRIANMHPRVNILQPGPGVGGHCIPVDPWFLVGDFPQHTELIQTSLRINEAMPELVLEKISQIAEQKGIKDTSKIGIYGLAYKPNVDDYRESPTIQLLDSMEKHFAKPFKVYDPMITEKKVESQILDFDQFLSSSELIVIMVSHHHLIENMSRLNTKIVFDTQHILPDADYYL